MLLTQFQPAAGSLLVTTGRASVLGRCFRKVG